MEKNRIACYFTETKIKWNFINWFRAVKINLQIKPKIFFTCKKWFIFVRKFLLVEGFNNYSILGNNLMLIIANRCGNIIIIVLFSIINLNKYCILKKSDNCKNSF